MRLPLSLPLTQQRLLLEPFRQPAGRAIPWESRLLGLAVAVLAVVRMALRDTSVEYAARSTV